MTLRQLRTLLFVLVLSGFSSNPAMAFFTAACSFGEVDTLSKELKTQYEKSIEESNEHGTSVSFLRRILAERKLSRSKDAEYFGDFLMWKWFYDNHVDHVARDGFSSLVTKAAKETKNELLSLSLDCLNAIRMRTPSIAYLVAEKDGLEVLTKDKSKRFSEVVNRTKIFRALQQQGVSFSPATGEIQEKWLKAIQSAEAHVQSAGDATKLATAVRDWEELAKQNQANDLKYFANLTLGRLYYEQKKYDLAIAALGKVDANSRLFAEAMIAKSWAYLMAKDYERTLGIGYSFQLEPLSRSFAPEALLVTGIAFFENCQYPEAIKTVKLYFERYVSSYKWLKAWPGSKTDPYALVLKLVKKDPSVPADVTAYLLSSPFFLSNQSELNLLFEEDAFFKKNAAVPELKNIAQDYQRKRGEFEKTILARIRSAISARIAEMNRQLEENAELAQLLEADSLNFSGEGIMQKYADSGQKPKTDEATKAENKKNAENRKVPGGITWGSVASTALGKQEIWRDELDFLKADISSECKTKSKH